MSHTISVKQGDFKAQEFSSQARRRTETLSLIAALADNAASLEKNQPKSRIISQRWYQPTIHEGRPPMNLASASSLMVIVLFVLNTLASAGHAEASLWMVCLLTPIALAIGFLAAAWNLKLMERFLKSDEFAVNTLLYMAWPLVVGIGASIAGQVFGDSFTLLLRP